MTTTEHATEPVLVGVDDSPASLTAMRVAADEAALRGTDLLAVHVWHFPSTWGVPLTWPKGANPGQFVLDRLNAEVAHVQAERNAAGKPEVSVSVEVIEGDTIKELRTAGAKAAILVLGERGRFSPQKILGSVSHALVTRPPCLVMIVPANDD
jgi:nucleotide-binding universal stress UspA family protein